MNQESALRRWRRRPDAFPTFRKGLLAVCLALAAAELMDGEGGSVRSLAPILFGLAVMLPVPLAAPVGLTVGSVLLALVWRNEPALLTEGLLEVCTLGVLGAVVRRFLLPIEWRLASRAVLGQLLERVGAFSVEEVLRRMLQQMGELAGAQGVLALRQVDGVTAEALVALPDTTLAEALSTPRLFSKALAQNRCLYFADYARDPDAVPSLVARDVRALAVLPLHWGGQGSSEKRSFHGAIVLVWRRRTPFHPHLRRFLEQLRDGLQTLLQFMDANQRFDQLQSRYAAILETLHQGVVFVEASGQQGWINRVAAAHLGLPAGALPPATIAEAMARLRNQASNREEIQEKAAQLFTNPQVELRDWLWTFSQPEERVLSLSTIPTHMRDVPGRLWLLDDVTESHRARRALARRTTQLEAVNQGLRLTQFVVDSATDAILWVGPDARLLYANGATCGALGYSSDELLSMTFLDIDAGLTLERWQDWWQELAGNGSTTRESLFRTREGRFFPVEMRSTFMDFGGRQYGCVFARDITARKQAEEALHAEKEKSERLLLNVLPQSIARRLKQETRTIADGFAEATILFADLVDFSQLADQLPPTELVYLLNELFSAFDELTERYGLEKIKTIGDAYMVAGGLPTPRRDHAEAIAEMALDMMAFVHRFNTTRGTSVRLRSGIHSGPVVAGVIGTKKFSYDLWGDTVNTASRMESHGVPGGIQVTQPTYELLRDQYTFIERGRILVKSKGEMATWLLTGRRE
jgi:PAS domain S-box-containing protein